MLKTKQGIAILCLITLIFNLIPGFSVQSAGLENRPVISEKADQILQLLAPMRINDEGVLEYFNPASSSFQAVGLIESHRHLIYPYKPVEAVNFLIIHYDAAPNLDKNGLPGKVQTTMQNLNDWRMIGINFVVDSYPITPVNEGDKGMGVIMGTAPNPIPYRGRHVLISVNPDRGLDKNSIETAKRFESVGINSKLFAFNLDPLKDMDSVSLGVEQSGNDFSRSFPHNLPPDQEIANLLSLIIAVANRYNLQVWDILGHNEIQQKPDPGDEYMLILRFLLGVIACQDSTRLPEGFLNDSPEVYFAKLQLLGLAQMGELRFEAVDNYLGIRNYTTYFEDLLPESAPARQATLDQSESNAFQFTEFIPGLDSIPFSCCPLQCFQDK